MKPAIFIAAVITLTTACKHREDKPAAPPLIKKEKSDSTVARQKSPIINIADTVEQKRIVLCVKDSAATAAGLSLKLAAIYNRRIPEAARVLRIRTNGSPMAWFKTQKPPFFFEAGLPIEKAIAKLPAGMYLKTTGGDSAVVAHFFGPYELSNLAYDALREMLNDKQKNKQHAAYEIYISNPFELKKAKADPYKAETDIVLPYE